MARPSLRRFLGRARGRSRRVALFEGLVDATSRLGASHPGADPAVYGLEARRDLSYGPAAHQKLDLTLPVDRPGPWPVVLYAHGGGFRVMSKESHWMMALAFARRGYLVANLDYRLATEAPYPAAHRDMARAWSWAVEHVAEHGGDPARIVVAGDSAGANLAFSLALQASHPRPEPWAREVFDLGRVPAAVVGLCGLYQVSDLGRLVPGWSPSSPVRRWVSAVERSVLGDGAAAPLADPLLLVERPTPLVRPFPPVCLSVGADDPVLQDSERLLRALEDRDIRCTLEVYVGEGHAFQMLTWRPAAKRAWADVFAFLREHGPVPPPKPPASPPDSVRERLERGVRRRLLAALSA